MGFALTTLAALGIALAAGGCAAPRESHSKAEPENDRQYGKTITIGKTTKSDIRRLLGEPTEKGASDGRDFWVYHPAGVAQAQGATAEGIDLELDSGYLVIGRSGFTGRFLQITFDSNDVVISLRVGDKQG